MNDRAILVVYRYDARQKGPKHVIGAFEGEGHLEGCTRLEGVLPVCQYCRM